ncbi:MAG: glycogen synthase [Treponema sp.]|nr:glycogen synthase [Treponema sp.]
MKNNQLFVVSREFADIAEAGGVKNVAFFLSKEASENGFDVTLFIPQYGCTKLDKITDYSKFEHYSTSISINWSSHHIEYAVGYFEKIKVIFVISPYFLSKLGVYTYTKKEEKQNPSHISGTGHEDALLMDVLFQKAVLEFSKLSGIIPNIVHCHDAATSLIPFFANKIHTYSEIFKNTSFFVTIHNAGPGYHHEFNNIETAKSLCELPHNDLIEGLLDDTVEPYLLASKYATITTVSPNYANELLCIQNDYSGGLSKEFVKRNIKIIGITNGIEFERYDPSNKKSSLLNYEYNPEILDLKGKKKERLNFIKTFSQFNELENVDQFGTIQADESSILFAHHGRMVWQKGIEILENAVEIVLRNCENARFVVMGQGQVELEDKNMMLTQKYPGKFLYFRGYDRFLARECVAISDFIVLPSVFEPCGLEDLIAQIFGTVPVASATGGLNKINHGIDGFLYEPNTPEKLSSVLCDLYEKLINNRDFLNNFIQNGAKKARYDYSWKNVFNNNYKPLYLQQFF